MLIKITKSCANGCSHCMNDARACKEHMTKETFIDALKFCQKYDNNFLGDLISGGEPTEHPFFLEFLDIYYTFYNDKERMCSVLTNGHWIVDNQEKTLELLDKYPGLSFQVTFDSTYYPKKLDITKRIFRNKRICVVTNVDNIYPQGRALYNNLKVGNKVIAPKCFNTRLLAAQLGDKGLYSVIKGLRDFNKYCIPAIHYDGKIGFGESDLCPRYCSIYDDETFIIEKMLFNSCSACPIKVDDFRVISTLANGQIRWELNHKENFYENH